ncbi:nitroreductase family protein [Croceibacterium ferulae]|uniref:nitroreductase family protein n=1 Tax=Croceibacterium ferulae TaxID=1854641 RepID=UPI000EAF4E2D|nr:nitroreductase family protein [Croceibacterium ferulae]
MHQRRSDLPVSPTVLKRWSTRAFDGREMPHEDLLTMLEAGRWAPSAFNAQPWTFLYAMRDDDHWADFLSLLIPFNAMWASTASALVFVVSDTMPDVGKGPAPSHSHSFDSGAAWAMVAWQAAEMGYMTHAMTGLDFERASVQLGLSPTVRLEAAFVVGRQGDGAQLPDYLLAREEPSDRKPLVEIALRGPFPNGI